MEGLNSRLARGTIQETEDYTGAWPFSLNSLGYAINMKKMLALKLDARGLAQTVSVANGAELFSVDSHSEGFFFGYAIRMQTGQALSLILETAARMATHENFVAGFAHKINADWISAKFFEGWHH